MSEDDEWTDELRMWIDEASTDESFEKYDTCGYSGALGCAVILAFLALAWAGFFVLAVRFFG